MHDQNFKNLILDYPVQALEFFAGEEAGSDLSNAAEPQLSVVSCQHWRLF